VRLFNFRNGDSIRARSRRAIGGIARPRARDWDDLAGKCLSASRFHLFFLPFPAEESHRARCHSVASLAHCEHVEGILSASSVV